MIIDILVQKTCRLFGTYVSSCESPCRQFLHKRLIYMRLARRSLPYRYVCTIEKAGF